MIVQPTVPSCRLSYFRRLHAEFGLSFSVHASPKHLGVLTEAWDPRPWPLGRMRKVLPGLEWQPGALKIPISSADVVVISGAPRCVPNIALLLKARLMGATTLWWGQHMSVMSKGWRARLRFWLAGVAHAPLNSTDHEIADYRAQFGEVRRPEVFALNNGIETGEIA